MESFINNAMERDEEEQEDNQENNPVIKDLDETQTSEDEYPKDDYVNEYSKPEEAQAQEEESVVETDPEPEQVVDEVNEEAPASVQEEVREEPAQEEVQEEEPEPKPEIKREIPEVKSVPRQQEVRTTSKPMRQHELDAELEMLLAKQKATVKVIGTGGGGNNTINRITEVGIEGSETIAMNTDAQDLLYTTADKKILLGRELTGGLGAGSIPKIGEEAAMESEQDIKHALQGADMVFVTCGLGGGTGTGSAPVVASIAKKLGALTVAIVTLPFSMEGNRRYDNAILGLERLQETVDTLIVIPNDKLLELAPDLPMQTAFKVADEILTNAVKGIAELVTKAGLVNLDFADIRAVMGNGGVALIGVGESDTENRATEAVERAINNPLLDADITGANGALINVAGGPDMTLEEARRVVESVSEKLDEDARVIWGAQISADLSGMIRTMLIVTGVKSSQILGGVKKPKTKDQKEAEMELGIEFM